MKRKLFFNRLIFTLVAVFGFLFGQAQHHAVEVVDQGLGTLQTPDGLIQAPVFDQPLVADERTGGWPVLSMVVKGSEGRLLNAAYQPYPTEGLQNLMAYLSKRVMAAPTAWPMKSRGEFATLLHVPAYRIAANGQLEVLSSLTYQVVESTSSTMAVSKVLQATNSVLANGVWARVAVSTSGMYKLTPSFLADAGLGNNLPVAALRVFGNGGAPLPEPNAISRTDDLAELTIEVVDDGDGIFNGSDYALFYATGPHHWTYQGSTGRMAHVFNPYSDKSYYFITAQGVGKRVPVVSGPSGPGVVVQSFTDLAFHELDLVNVLGCGRTWYGEKFDFTTSYTFNFNFPNAALGQPALLVQRAIARSTSVATSYTTAVNGSLVLNQGMSPVGNGSFAAYATENINTANIPAASGVAVTINYNKNGNASAAGWLDYLEVHMPRSLTLGTAPLYVYRPGTGSPTVIDYQVVTSGTGRVWEVTRFNDAREIQVTPMGIGFSFKGVEDSLRQYVVFNGSNFPQPEALGLVQNQNLHGLSTPDMIMVVPPAFASEAERLADFHRQRGLSVELVSPQQVYNEFSSGSQDPTAIRDFMRMFYLRGNQSGVYPKYLLLFGDASYDYKDRIPANSNLVPTYEDVYSLNLGSSKVSDDYFGLLDDTEGADVRVGLIDVGIGRLPVATAAQAKVAVDQILAYATDPDRFGEWQNRVIYSADDVDINQGWEIAFVDYSERASLVLESKRLGFNPSKVYADAYVQEVLGGSQRYPKAQEDLFRQVQDGALALFYIGHGGEIGWASERILQLNEVNGWSNGPKSPVVVTITCEFSRFDDPNRVSAGEQMFLNPDGAAIALMSTFRAVYATPSTINISKQISDTLLSRQLDGTPLNMGDVVRIVKNTNSSSDRAVFGLLGDPALPINLPQHQAKTDLINGQPLGSADTLKALSKVKVEGHVEDYVGNALTGFNGTIYPVVFDKPTQRTTLMNDGTGVPWPFNEEKNILYKGAVPVVDGQFSFEFVVPLDINYAFGEGRINYFFTDGQTSGHGGSRDVVVGGFDEQAPDDNDPPTIALYMNDTLFRNGGLTDENPVFLAYVADSNGINVSGSGVGHDALLILDGNTANPLVLNSYYSAELGSYQKGVFTYPFFGLPAGKHTLTFRVWDTYNNPSQASISFVVAPRSGLAIDKVMNYPNPFTTRTRFQIEHNRPDEELMLDLAIYNLQGAIVRRWQEKVFTEGTRFVDLEWDGTNANGKLLPDGLYIYKVEIASSDGQTQSANNKLLIVR